MMLGRREVCTKIIQYCFGVFPMLLQELKEQAYKLSKGDVMQNLDNLTTEKINAVINLDKDEQELLDSIESDNWVSIPDPKLEIKHFQDIARCQISMQKIELQISIQDSDKIYSLANQLGLSACNFAEDIVHKYLKGELVEKS
jgi:predicted DNA binding CopG/RHH family protein